MHEQKKIASCEGFGSILSCSCGLYHIHLPGMSVHLNKKNFTRLIQIILQAKEDKDLYRSNETESEKNYLSLVKH